MRKPSAQRHIKISHCAVSKPSAQWSLNKNILERCAVSKPSAQWCKNKNILDHCAVSNPSAQRHLTHCDDRIVSSRWRCKKYINNNYYVGRKFSAWWCLNKNIIDIVLWANPQHHDILLIIVFGELPHHNEKT